MRYRDLALSANVSILFPELNYLDRFAAARATGFDAVESWWPFTVGAPERSAITPVLDAVRNSGVQLTGLNLWAGDMSAGQRGMAVHANRHEELAANVRLVAEIARETGCRHFNLLFGQIAPGQALQEARSAAGRAFRDAVDVLDAVGGTVLLEPLARGLNGEYPIHTVDDALGFLDAEAPGAALLFDTFHLGHNGEDVVGAAKSHAARVGHVQIADNPGRGEPGTGTLPIAGCLDTLVEGGYVGRVGVEYRPSTAHTEDSLAWLAR